MPWASLTHKVGIVPGDRLVLTAQSLLSDRFWTGGLVRGALDLTGLREFPRLAGFPQSSKRNGPTRFKLALTDKAMYLGTGPLL